MSFPSDFTSSVYPVNGTNGDSPSFITYFEFPITPNITGCCASSPSKKKPTTTSPGAILIGLKCPALPDPN